MPRAQRVRSVGSTEARESTDGWFSTYFSGDDPVLCRISLTNKHVWPKQVHQIWLPLTASP